jgi:1-phosphatidylinositol phosphodiesterase
MKLKQYIFLFLLLFILDQGNVISCDEDFKGHESNISSKTSFLDSREWMKNLDGNSLLSNLSIPGTHDSCTYNYNGNVPFVKTQYNNLSMQFINGVRFFDIRCRQVGNKLKIYHGSFFMELDLNDVLLNFNIFLTSHPSETILMSVKTEGEPINPIDDFETVFKKYVTDMNRHTKRGRLKHDLIYTEKTIPTLSAVRGYVVLLRRFDMINPIGIDLTDWPDNTEKSDVPPNKDGVVYSIQDHYNISGYEGSTIAKLDHKLEIVYSLIQDASIVGGRNPSQLFLNFTSCLIGPEDGIVNIITPLQAAKYINPYASKYLEQISKKRNIGIIITDYCGNPNLFMKKIILLNNFNS